MDPEARKIELHARDDEQLNCPARERWRSRADQVEAARTDGEPPSSRPMIPG